MPKLSDPVALDLFGLTIRWYAIFILTGIVVALVLMRWLARYRGLDPDFPLDAAPFVILAALVGADPGGELALPVATKEQADLPQVLLFVFFLRSCYHI